MSRPKGEEMPKVLDKYKKQSNEIRRITSVDFNCDLAQGFGIYKNENEFDMLDWVSSVNISTGFHAGDPLSIKNAILKAKEKNLVIGAHIGFRDIEGFGHRLMNLSEEEIEATVVYQIGAIMSFAKAYGLEIEHVRPHGAMYKLAGENFSFACSIAKAIKKCSQWLVYYGPSGDITEKTGEFVKLPIAHEVRLDRNYNTDGSVDYSTNGIINTEFSLRRLQNLLRASQIDNNSNGQTVVKVDTIHFSSRVANSIDLAKRANEIIKPIPVNYNKVKDSGWV